jgi:hypothetical protein
VAEVELPDVDGRWRKPIRRLAESLRRGLLAHPAVMPAVNVHAAGGQASSAVVDRAHGILRGAGFADEQAVAAVDTLYAFTLGAVSLELARALADPAAGRGVDRFRNGLDRVLAGIAAAGRAPAT